MKSKKILVYLSVFVVLTLLLQLIRFNTEALNTLYFLVAFFTSLTYGVAFFISAHSLAKIKWFTSIYPYFKYLYQLLLGTFIIAMLLMFFNPQMPWKQEGFENQSNFFQIYNSFLPYSLRQLTYYLVGIWFSKKLLNPVNAASTKIKGATVFISFIGLNFMAWDYILVFIKDWSSPLFSWIYFVIYVHIAVAFIILIIPRRFLQTQFYLSRYLFSISIIQAYLWYSQLMLNWYGNLPSESIFLMQLKSNPFIWFSFILTMVLPIISLFSEKAKKRYVLNKTVATLVILGNFWILYCLIHPKIEVNLLIYDTLIFIGMFFILFIVCSRKISLLHFRKLSHNPLILICLCMLSCSSNNQHPGYNYLPEMTKNLVPTPFTQDTIESGILYLAKPVVGTVPREQIPYFLSRTNKLHRIQASNIYINPYQKLDKKIISQGEKLFNIHCSLCHGSSGNGKGSLHTSGKFMYPPANLTSQKIDTLPDGELYHIISVGKGIMKAHASAVKPKDRWAIIAWVNYLQESN